MDSKAYQEETRRTRAPNDNLGRGLFDNDLQVLRELMTLSYAGDIGDAMKRSLFYRDGKVKERLDKASVTNKEIFEALDGREKNLEHDPLVLSEKDYDLLHALAGAASEIGEIVQELVLSYLQKRPLDRVNLVEEWGDVLWYTSLGLDHAETDFGTAFEANIAKLRARYPDKFKKADALDRDTGAERKALEEAAA